MLAALAMVKCLQAEGIKDIFGYPGAAICPFYDALVDSGIRHVLVRQEQNAAHAASGYARVTGKPAVCVATSGPGATNLITGIATAYSDSIPMVAITGQVSTDQIGRDVFQEADVTGAAEPFVKHSYLVKDASDIPRIFKEAFYIAGSGRPGPVLIDVPIDVQQTDIKFEYPDSVNIRGYKPSVKGHPLQIKRVLSAVSSAKKPVICAGGGVFACGAQKALVQFAERCDVPVITTMMGIGSIPSAHPLCFGMLGTYGVKVANYAINQADLLILIGARVGDRAVTAPNTIAETTKIIHIDIDPAEIGKNMDVHIPLVGDAKIILKQLISKVEGEFDRSGWKNELCQIRAESEKPVCEKSGYINPKLFMKKLSNIAPDDCVAVADVGQNQIWSTNCFEVKKGRFFTTGGMGTMGYSLGAALGAKVADGSKQVIAVCGDGSFQMQMMELATMCQHGIDVKIIIMRNNRLGMVRELQKNNYNGKYEAVFLDGSPDFAALAGAYGIPALRISENSEIESAVKQAFDHKGTFLLECAVDPEAPSLL